MSSGKGGGGQCVASADLTAERFACKASVSNENWWCSTAFLNPSFHIYTQITRINSLCTLLLCHLSSFFHSHLTSLFHLPSARDVVPPVLPSSSSPHASRRPFLSWATPPARHALPKNKGRGRRQCQRQTTVLPPFALLRHFRRVHWLGRPCKYISIYVPRRSSVRFRCLRMHDQHFATTFLRIYHTSSLPIVFYFLSSSTLS